MIWIALGLGLVVLLFLVQLFHLSFVLGWADQATRGLGYYGLPPEGREQFRRKLRTHARLLWPIMRINERFTKFDFERATFHERGLAGPRGTCSPESFAAGMDYTPRPEDVFVVTAMKCGTTWMQHVVYEVLMRGRGDIVDSGRTLYAISPWAEGLKSVSLADAPLVGSERPSRIIKTHLPAPHCPWNPASRYIYVSRHPVSCYASCVDFLRTNAGAIAPTREQSTEWFMSDELMWWGTWPDHVRAWWERAQSEPNVFFVRFEDMKADLPEVVRQVAAFLGVAALSMQELAEVVRKCGFDYMSQHTDAFEMHPPHLMQTDAELFVRGSANRHADVPDALRSRLLDWCADALKDSGARSLYPDLERGAVPT